MRISHLFLQILDGICCEIQKFCAASHFEKPRTFVTCYSKTNTFLFLKTDGGQKKTDEGEMTVMWKPPQFHELRYMTHLTGVNTLKYYSII